MRRTPQAKRTVERLREHVLSGGDGRLTADDRNAIIRFDEQFSTDRKKNGRAGWQHHRNKLRDIIFFAEETQCLAATLEDGQTGSDAVDEIVDWITNQDASGYTVQANLSTLRVFAQTVLREIPSASRKSNIVFDDQRVFAVGRSKDDCVVVGNLLADAVTHPLVKLTVCRHRREV
jgi:hypothetical protein